jgi:ribosomal protein L11 methyltransferase
LNAEPAGQAAYSVRLVCDQAAASRLSEEIGARLDRDDIAVSFFELPDAWCVELTFPEEPDREAITKIVAACADPAVAQSLTFTTVAARDWVAQSLSGLAPVLAGRFVIHGSHDRSHIARNRIGILIDAALAFGTGHHGTTRGCLLAFDRLLKSKRPVRVLDIGTGTGVLAIAAAKAVRQRVLASDIDPVAVATARRNAHLNDAGTLVEAICAANVGQARFRARAPYDLIFANILLAPLKRLARPAAHLLAPEGRIVLSGLLLAHEPAAVSAYRAQGLALEGRIRLGEWVTLVMRRQVRKRQPPKRQRPGTRPGRWL